MALVSSASLPNLKFLDKKLGTPSSSSTKGIGRVYLVKANASNSTENDLNAVNVPMSLQDEIIKREFQKENEKFALRQQEAVAEKQRMLDKARKEMREWWLEKWNAKKRSEGWGEYEKCWLLEPLYESKEIQPAVLSGEGVLVGAVPLVSSSIRPLVVNLPMVSGVHAHVYGKDVVKGYRKLVREYFVVDLGSTNGTYLNKLKLRPRAEVKLSSGDELMFGDPGAIFRLRKQSL